MSTPATDPAHGLRILGIGFGLLLCAAHRPALAQDDAEPVPTVINEPIVRGLSWDIMAGGIPRSGAIGQAELGFSGLPRVAYHYTLSPEMSLGGLVGFDYGTYVPDNVFAPNLVVAVPIRYAIYRDESLSFAIRGDPGLVFGFDPGAVGLQALISAVVGFSVENRFVIGGGVDFPITFAILTASQLGTNINRAFLSMPILVGPIAEFHVTPPLAITLDAKFGPSFDTRGKPRFAMKIHAGAALRF